jgi:hypothetical protein
LQYDREILVSQLSLRASGWALFFLISSSSAALACSCGGPPESRAEADLVVLGSVKSITYGIEWIDPEVATEGYRVARAEFEISQVTKGNYKGDSISIYTGAGTGDCGRLMELLNLAIYYNHQDFGVAELGLKKIDVQGQTLYLTTICDFAKWPQNMTEDP